ncbi:MAG: hypothetical protein HQL24_07975, partial [Candidatus Omnitrophica bacterium]|nr:hypothetical protein [Candidatus Omnitrophota bacterium]
NQSTSSQAASSHPAFSSLSSRAQTRDPGSKNGLLDSRLRGNDRKISGNDKLSSSIIKQIILPEIEKEVNEGKNFAPLRQIYHSLILAKWYKEKVRNSILSSSYINKNKVTGIDENNPKAKEEIYAQYMEAYKKGVYNYMKEEYDPKTQQITPKKYFSGGFKDADLAMKTASAKEIARSIVGQDFNMSVNIAGKNDKAIASKEAIDHYREALKTAQYFPAIKEIIDQLKSLGDPKIKIYQQVYQRLVDSLLGYAFQDYVEIGEYFQKALKIRLSGYDFIIEVSDITNEQLVLATDWRLTPYFYMQITRGEKIADATDQAMMSRSYSPGEWPRGDEDEDTTPLSERNARNTIIKNLRVADKEYLITSEHIALAEKYLADGFDIDVKYVPAEFHNIGIPVGESPYWTEESLTVSQGKSLKSESEETFPRYVPVGEWRNPWDKDNALVTDKAMLVWPGTTDWHIQKGLKSSNPKKQIKAINALAYRYLNQPQYQAKIKQALFNHLGYERSSKQSRQAVRTILKNFHVLPSELIDANFKALLASSNYVAVKEAIDQLEELGHPQAKISREVFRKILADRAPINLFRKALGIRVSGYDFKINHSPEVSHKEFFSWADSMTGYSYSGETKVIDSPERWEVVKGEKLSDATDKAMMGDSDRLPDWYTDADGTVHYWLDLGAGIGSWQTIPPHDSDNSPEAEKKTSDQAMLVPWTTDWYIEKGLESDNPTKQIKAVNILARRYNTQPKIIKEVYEKLKDSESFYNISYVFKKALKIRLEGYNFEIIKIFHPQESHEVFVAAEISQGEYENELEWAQKEPYFPMSGRSPVDYYKTVVDKAEYTSFEIVRGEKIVDKALVTDNNVGGIDMNSINLKSDAKGTFTFQFDPKVMEQFKDVPIDNLSPVIINIVPIPSIFPLLGLAEPSKENLEKKAELSPMDKVG